MGKYSESYSDSHLESLSESNLDSHSESHLESHYVGTCSDHACIRMVNIGRRLLDPNFKKISSIGEYLRLIVMY